MKIEGFAAFEDGQPVEMELSDEIVGGIILTDPLPVFKDADDAESAVMSNQSRYGSVATFEIRKVIIEVGDIVNTVTYDENAKDDEDED